MQTIEFSAEEVELLREVLQHKADETDVEMFRTDTHDFKEKLKHQRAIIEQILAKLSHAPLVARG